MSTVAESTAGSDYASAVEDVVDEELAGAVFACARQGDARTLRDLCQQIVRHGLDRAALSTPDELGVTPLIIAARNKHVACVEALLEHNVDADYINPVPPSEPAVTNQGSALHEAAAGKGSGYEQIVRLLLRHGAEPWAANPTGATAFDLALQSGAPGSISAIRSQALCQATVKAKCCLHYYDSLIGLYKPCEAVVTPYFPFTSNRSETPPMKRVYLFKGNHVKAVLTYDAADVIKTRGHRAQLRMHDPNVEAVRQPNEDFVRALQDGYRRFTTVGFALAPIGCSMVLANVAATASPNYFQLMTTGRKNELQDSASHEGHTMQTSVFFRPAEGISIRMYDAFLESLSGPRNEALFLLDLQGNRHLTRSDSIASSSDSSAGIDVQPMPEDLDRKAVEPVCSVCLSEPCERGYLHNNNRTLHACVCVYCVRVAPVGSACPVCRQPVEGIVSLPPPSHRPSC